MNRSARRSSGYTLLELVLVLVVLAIVSAMAAPSLRGFGAGRKADEAASQFVSLTRWARTQAIADGCPYRIVIDAAAGTWRVQVQEIDTFIDVDGPLGKQFTAPEGVQVSTNAPAEQGLNVINFDALGRADPADVVFTGPRGEVGVTCELPIDEYHVVTDAEART
jgi:general secretion pathway protein H